MRTIAVSNFKGGVGKTTTTRILGDILAESGLRVLLVDLDPQCSLTGACGLREAADDNMADVMGSVQRGSKGIGDVLYRVKDRLYLAPADIQLHLSEGGLFLRPNREYVLRGALDKIADLFDICLVDTPPSLGMLTQNALAAANHVIVPTVPEILALRGLNLFLDQVRHLQEENNRLLSLMGVLIVMMDRRTRHHTDAESVIRGAGYPVFRTVIGRSVRVAEAVVGGQSVTEYDPSNKRAIEYADFAKEVVECLSR